MFQISVSENIELPFEICTVIEAVLEQLLLLAGISRIFLLMLILADLSCRYYTITKSSCPCVCCYVFQFSVCENSRTVL